MPDYSKQYSSLPSYRDPEEEREMQQRLAEAGNMQGYGNYLDSLSPNSTPAMPPEKPPMVADQDVPTPAPQMPSRPLLAGNSDDTEVPNIPKLSDLVKDTISNRYQQGSPQDFSLDALKNAQEEQRKMRLISGMGNAVDTFQHAISRSSQPVDDSFYNTMSKNASAPVENLAALRTAATQNEDLGRKQALNDPNSMQSRVARNVAAAQLKDAGVDPKQIEGMSAADLSGFMQKSLANLESAAARKQQGRLSADFRDSQAQEKMDFRAHQQILQRLRSDKTLTESATKAQNLQNTLSNVDKTGMITAQDMADIQALAVSNMGIGGGSSAHERAERYAKSLGIKAADAMQFLTGKPQDIGKDNPLFQRYKDIMNLEIGNFRTRAEKRIDALTHGNESVYRRNPDKAADLDSAKEAIFGQLPSASNAPSAGKDPKVTQYAQQNGIDYNHALQILKSRGYNG